MACIIWYTKRQTTVENAVFGAEFVAMKQATEDSSRIVIQIQDDGITHRGTYPYVWR